MSIPNHDSAANRLAVTAAAGLAGAMLLLAGDLLLYAHDADLPPVAPEVHAVLGPRQAILLATPKQLIASSVIGPLAAALYAFGAWHVYMRLAAASRRWAATAGVLWLLSFCLSGAYHALWGPFGSIVAFANDNPAGISLMAQAAANLHALLTVSTFVALPAIIITLLLVAGGKSEYPRWTAPLNPFLWYGIGTAVLGVAANQLPHPWGAVLLGSLYNALMVLFFLMSLLTLRSNLSPQRC
jgi:hypothetical protein